MSTQSPAPRSIPWDQLLELVEGGHVIPVVGEELVTVNDGGRDRKLHDYLAERLATVLSTEWAPGETLNTVAGRYIGGKGGEKGDPQSVYSALKSLFRDEPVRSAAPQALEKLAAITHFKLYLTTTFDDTLTRSIDRVRHGGSQQTTVVAYSPTRANDLTSDIDQLERPTVFHLFGRISAIQEYAVTDEDVLEFIHCLQSESRHPARLFQQLGQKRLLVIGSLLGDWLTRFFLRMSKPEPFALRRLGDYLVNTEQCGELVVFLRQFYGRTLVYPKHPQEFVNELHARWTERNARASDRSLTHGPPSALTLPKGAVFVSYATEDRDVAAAICRSLDAAGIDATWLDVRELEPGDIVDRKIRKTIEQSAMFVAVLSSHSLTAERRYFRREWDYAIDVSKTVKSGTPFIVPVFLDATDRLDPGFPDEFRVPLGVHMAGAEVPSNLVDGIVKAYRAFQLQSSA